MFFTVSDTFVLYLSLLALHNFSLAGSQFHLMSKEEKKHLERAGNEPKSSCSASDYSTSTLE